MLSDSSRRALLSLARRSIAEYLGGNAETALEKRGGANRDLYDDRKILAAEELQVRRGVFVTLHVKSEGKEPPRLRGCIGSIIGREPLAGAVARLAVESAVADPRFRPVRTIRELEELEIEISVLTPPASVPSWRDIEIGRDGILLHCRSRSAVFLPQVAVEQGWGLSETLSHLALKAGLLPDSWKEPGCNFETFQAEVFAEKDDWI